MSGASDPSANDPPSIALAIDLLPRGGGAVVPWEAPRGGYRRPIQARMRIGTHRPPCCSGAESQCIELDVVN
jgi:hypothetical protein